MGRPKGSKNKRKARRRFMSDSYIIDNGGSGKEVPIVKRANQLDAILAKADAPRVVEKPKDEVVAGDETTKAYKSSFGGKEESVIEEPKNLVYGHCNNCRLELTEEKVVKNAIDWLRGEDGTLTKAATRFSIFCKNCMKFICVLDNDAQKMLNDMIRKGTR
jgi:hypothetical protein